MWHTGRPAVEQCEGCTFNTSHITEPAYLHSRDVSYAVLCEGPYEEALRYRDGTLARAAGSDRLCGARRRPRRNAGRMDCVYVLTAPWPTVRAKELIAPVTLLSRKATRGATSSTVPVRPSGVSATFAARNAGAAEAVIGVSMCPGWMVLTRMPRGPSSRQAVLANPRNAHLLAV
jgi:hypothetical protein